MKIAYIADYNPQDLNAWSGTSHYIYKTLSERHSVVWIGKDLCMGALWHHRFTLSNRPFFPHDFSHEIGVLLSNITAVWLRSGACGLAY